jgi:hypothetical protein
LLLKNGFVSIFPKEFVLNSIAQYTKKNGKAPKVLAVSNEDMIDYRMSCTTPSAEWFRNVGIEHFVTNDGLSSGEMDLAMGIKNETGEVS